MRDKIHLWVATEFSTYPSGRDEKDGPKSGQHFRDDLLAPKLREAINNSNILVVHLDGVMSFGSSFLEEAFGGLVRKNGFTQAELRKSLEIDPGWVGNSRYKEAILRYIAEARA